MRVFILIPALLSVVAADRILVLLESLTAREKYSLFFMSLEERGHQLFYAAADDPTVSILQYGMKAYDHLIIFSPSVEEFGGSLNVNAINKFLDDDGNILVAGGPHLGQGIRKLALENGFEFDDTKTMVIDHVNYDTHLDDGYHTTIVATKEQLIDAQLLTGGSELKPILYKGIGMVSHSKSNKLRLEVLRGTYTTYSFDPKAPVDEYPAAIGQQVVLVGAVQARNNARVVFTGSVDMFSDEYLSADVHHFAKGATASRCGNLELVVALSRWAFGESGILRVAKVEHRLVGSKKKNPREYTIMDEVVYEIEIDEYLDGEWQPFGAKDVQLEFVRIDPFIRTTLKNENGRFTARFKIPDVYGVYKFLVDYNRLGYTHLRDVKQVSVLPLKHTQYERFIRSAYPYYASSLSMMVGVVLFSFVFLYYKEPTKVATTAAKKTN